MKPSAIKWHSGQEKVKKMHFLVINPQHKIKKRNENCCHRTNMTNYKKKLSIVLLVSCLKSEDTRMLAVVARARDFSLEMIDSRKLSGFSTTGGLQQVYNVRFFC
jgi:hypothetical protein